MKKLFLGSLFFFLSSFCLAQKGTIKGIVEGIVEVKGIMFIGIFNKNEGFGEVGKEFIGNRINVETSPLTFIFEDVPIGTYAISVFHDINSDGKLNKNLFGVPKEGYGFSNNIFGVLGTIPDIEEASFNVESDKIISVMIKLKN